jgi:capsular polysaccharide transport system permease protein
LTLLGQSGGSTTSDAYILESYVLSQGLLTELDTQLELKKHYQNPQADFISRLEEMPTAEEFLKYYRRVIDIRFDSATGILGLKVRAFSPEFAQSISRAILERSEKLINELRDRAMNDLLSLARNEVAVAEKRLAAARQQLKQFRQKSDLLDPQVAAGAVLGLVAELEGQAAKARAELAEMRSYMQEESAGIVALKARSLALEQQAKVEKSRLTGKDSQVINEIFASFEELTVEHEFAQTP